MAKLKIPILSHGLLKNEGTALLIPKPCLDVLDMQYLHVGWKHLKLTFCEMNIEAINRVEGELA